MGACLLPLVLALGTHVGGAEPGPREGPLDRDYTFQWWAYGWRGLSPEGRHVLCFQTGSLGLALDVDRLEIRHLGRILHPKPYREAAADDNQVAFGLPPARLLLEVVAGPRRYRAVRAGFPSRIIESGRFFHRFRYDVLKPTRFTRLAFYQLGADHYNDAPVRRWVRGNARGMLEQCLPLPLGEGRGEGIGSRDSSSPSPNLSQRERGSGGTPQSVGTPKKDGYVRTGVPCEGPVPWFSLSHRERQDPKGGAWADRGLIVRDWKARLGGKDVPVPYVASFRTGTQAGNVNCEVVPPPGLNDLLPGDFVEGEVHLVVMPIAAEHYYGPNQNLRGAMGVMEKAGQPWKMILREAVGNDLEVTATRGKIVHRYPVLVEVDAEGRAEFSVQGGVGYVPITIGGLKHYRGFRLDRCDGGPWTPIDQSVHGNDFWQTDYDAAAGTWRLTYNVPLDTPGDARQTVRFRFGPK